MRMRGLGQQPSCLQPHDQVLRNHSVGKQMQRGGLRARDWLAVMRMSKSFGEFLAYSIWHVEVAVVVEHAGVGQFEFAIELAAAVVFLDELARTDIRLADIYRGRGDTTAGGRGVEIVVALLDVFAVVAFAVGQTEQPFFENRIAAVPERERKAEPAFTIGNAQAGHLHPSDRRGCGPDRGGNIPSSFRWRNNLRGRCPIGVRRGMVPNVSSSRRDWRLRPDEEIRHP